MYLGRGLYTAEHPVLIGIDVSRQKNFNIVGTQYVPCGLFSRATSDSIALLRSFFLSLTRL